MKSYILGNYQGLYPMTSVLFQPIHQDWQMNYTSIDMLIRDQFIDGSFENIDLPILHSELTTILSKDPKEQFEIFAVEFDPNYYIDKTHEHWAQFFFWTLLHFTEKEMQKRGIEIEKTSSENK